MAPVSRYRRAQVSRFLRGRGLLRCMQGSATASSGCASPSIPAPGSPTFNSICPGYVLTQLGADSRDSSQIDAWTSQSPLDRLADPVDVASLVVYLAGDAGYVTGQALNVNGGMCSW